MNPVLLFILLLASQRADSFDCYFTNFDDIDTLNISALPVKRDCKHHIIKNIGFIRSPKLPEAQQKRMLFLEEYYRCYTISFEAKFGFETEGVNIQLCDYMDNCDHFYEKIALLRLSIVSNITCDECHGDLCNSKDVGSEMKNSSYVEPSSYRRNLSIGAGGCGVVGGIGALIRLLCCRKSKSSKSSKV